MACLTQSSSKAYSVPGNGWWSRALGFLSSIRFAPKTRRLQIQESLSLGEKRFLAVVEFEGQRFLVGGGRQSVTLLTKLDPGADFSTLVTEWCERQRA